MIYLLDLKSYEEVCQEIPFSLPLGLWMINGLYLCIIRSPPDKAVNFCIQLECI